MLKIYTVNGQGNYGGGLAVIAAKSKVEAVKVLKAAEVNCWDNQWGLDFCESDAAVIKGSKIGGKPRLLDSFAYLE